MIITWVNICWLIIIIIIENNNNNSFNNFIELIRKKLRKKIFTKFKYGVRFVILMVTRLVIRVYEDKCTTSFKNIYLLRLPWWIDCRCRSIVVMRKVSLVTTTWFVWYEITLSNWWGLRRRLFVDEAAESWGPRDWHAVREDAIHKNTGRRGLIYLFGWSRRHACRELLPQCYAESNQRGAVLCSDRKRGYRFKPPAKWDRLIAVKGSHKKSIRFWLLQGDATYRTW